MRPVEERKIVIPFVLVVLFCTTAALPQVNKRALFQSAQTAIEEAKSDQAELLAPRTLEKAVEKLDEAQRDFERGENLNKIRKKLDEAVAAARHAREIAQMGLLAFKTLLPAREAAYKANAQQLAPDLLREAERYFTDAVKVLEYGDLNEAKQRGARAEEKYREAELVAIKAALLGKARQLHEEARNQKCDEFAPLTYGEAEAYLLEAEKLLDHDRYAKERATELASRAEDAFLHALSLRNKIRPAVGKPGLIERQLRNYEAQLARIAAEFNVQIGPEASPETVADQIITAIRKLKQDDEKLLQSLSERERALAELRDKIREIEQRHASLEEQLAQQKKQLEAQRIREAKIQKITNLFDPSEAEVLMSGRDLVIRLYGLSFPVGRATIDPRYFSLLAKVQEAIREFPQAHVTVEGHTDSQGDEKSNQRLSFERANAVRQYLLASMGLPEDRVSAIGYGESRPIASNETAEGRAKNRRIEIVLTLP